MMLTPIDGRDTLDLVNPGDFVEFVVPQGMLSAAFQTVIPTGVAWPGGAVLTGEQSLDGVAYAGFSTAVTVNSEGVTGTVSCIPGSMIRLRVTTVGTSAPVRVLCRAWNPNI